MQLLNNAFAIGAFLALATNVIAAPIAAPKPDPAVKTVTHTKYHTVVVPVTRKVYVDGGKTVVIPPYTTATTEEVSSTSSSSSSEPTSTSDEASTSTSAEPTSTSNTEEEETSTTSEAAPTVPAAETTEESAPTTTSTPPVVEPTLPPVIKEEPKPEPEEQKPQPEESKPQPAPVKEEPSAPASGNAKSSTGLGAFVGRATHFTPGMGACGVESTNGQNIVAVDHITFDKFTPNGNPNKNSLCGKSIRCTSPIKEGAEVIVTVVDRCPGCKEGDLDMSELAFQEFAALGVGHFPIECSWL